LDLAALVDAAGSMGTKLSGLKDIANEVRNIWRAWLPCWTAPIP